MTDHYDDFPPEDRPDRRMTPRHPLPGGLRRQPPRLASETRRPTIRRADDEFTIRTFDTSELDAIDEEDVILIEGEIEDDFDDDLDTDLDDLDVEDDDADEDFEEDDEDDAATEAEESPVRKGAPPARQSPPQARRRPRRRAARRAREQKPVPAWLSLVRTLVVIVAAAVLVSTIFSLWTRPTFFSEEFRAGLNQVQATQRVVNIQPTPLPTDIHQVRIGIIAGHSGAPQDTTFEVDPGAVCPDGLTELSINEEVARKVVEALQRDRYNVDLMEEFDPRLENYHADALVSIHTNDCSDYGAAGTGYNVASAAARQSTRGADERLLSCLIEQYGATTGLPRHFGITLDMTEYHTFGEVSIDTPTAIIELGYMRNDRAILTEDPELIAQGIANGIRCFLRPDLYSTANVPTQEAP
jgi:N-acetylmuramoyl-L-alanine amidase